MPLYLAAAVLESSHLQCIAVRVHQLLCQVVVREVSSSLRVVDSKESQQGVIIQLHPKGFAHVPEVLIVDLARVSLIKHLKELSELKAIVVVISHLQHDHVQLQFIGARSPNLSTSCSHPYLGLHALSHRCNHLGKPFAAHIVELCQKPALSLDIMITL
jgi:hypothetical protein